MPNTCTSNENNCMVDGLTCDDEKQRCRDHHLDHSHANDMFWSSSPETDYMWILLCSKEKIGQHNLISINDVTDRSNHHDIEGGGFTLQAVIAFLMSIRERVRQCNLISVTDVCDWSNHHDISLGESH